MATIWERVKTLMARKEVEQREIRMTDLSDTDIGDSPREDDLKRHLPRAIQGIDAVDTFYKMALDAQIEMCLNLVTAPLLSANWQFISPEEDDETLSEQAEVLNAFYTKNGAAFTATLDDICTFMQYGFSVMEKVYTLFEHDGKKYWLPKLKFRPQNTITKIQTTGDEKYVEQTTADGRKVRIPLTKCVINTLHKRGEDLTGRSIITSCYDSWKEKQEDLGTLRIGVRKNANGFIVGTLPTNNYAARSADVVELNRRFRRLGQTSLNDIIVPNGYTIDIKSFPYNPAGVIDVLKYRDLQISKAFMLSFMELGQMGNGGSYALGADQSQLFFYNIEFLARIVCQNFFSWVIKEACTINWGDGQSKFPELTANNINKGEMTAYADAFMKLSQAQIIKPTVMDEQDFRKRLNAKLLSEEEMEERKAASDAARAALTDLSGTPSPQGSPNIAKPSTQATNRNDGQNGNGGGTPPPTPARKLSDKAAADPLTPVVESGRPIVNPALLTAGGKRELYYENVTEKLLAFIRENLLRQKYEIMRQLEKKLDISNPATAVLHNLTVDVEAYQESLQKKLSGVVQSGWLLGGRALKEHRAAKKLSELPDELFNLPDFNVKNIKDAALRAYIINESNIVAENQATRMINSAYFSVRDSLGRDLPIEDALMRARAAMDDFIDGGIPGTTAEDLGVRGLNLGEDAFNTRGPASDYVVGFRFTNYDPVTAICKELEGKTYSKNSRIWKLVKPPLHYGCKSFYESIYDDEGITVFDNYMPSNPIPGF